MQIDVNKPTMEQVEQAITGERAEQLKQLEVAVANSNLSADEKQVLAELLERNPTLVGSRIPPSWRYMKPRIPGEEGGEK